ncbi:MAG TPA: hypothetical protein VMX17_08570 [Candidatus Glassbacteria bacterium]|nr:hypothetical protein [Candidatus Glassbacteria bacterium]
MKSELEKYLSKDSINNLFDRLTDVFIIELDIYGELQSGKNVGQVKLCIDVSKPYITNGDFVEFYLSKAKYKSVVVEDKMIAALNPRWVKLYNHDPKLKVRVPVLSSRVNEATNEREYYEDYEVMELTFKQYQKRRILKDFGDKYTFGQMEAYNNMSRRFQQHKDYYRALNETSKHYFVTHTFIKDVIFPEINNAKKRYRKDWRTFLMKQYQSNENEKRINDFLKDIKESVPENNVIQLNF